MSKWQCKLGISISLLLIAASYLAVVVFVDDVDVLATVAVDDDDDACAIVDGIDIGKVVVLF